MPGRSSTLIVTLFLVLLLVVAASFIVLNGSSGGIGGMGGTNNGGISNGGAPANNFSMEAGVPRNSHLQPPQLVIKAAIKQNSLLYSTSYTNTSSLPTYLFDPLSGLEVTLLQLGDVRARPFSIVTNSTGMVRALLSVGTYSLQIADPRFTMNTTIEARLNQTTVLSLHVGSALLPATFLELFEPGGVSELLPWRSIWVNTNTSGTPVTLSQNEPVFLVSVGANEHGSGPGHVLVVNATVKSSYSGQRGVWTAIRPLETSSFSGGRAVFLLVYIPQYTVTSIGG